MINVLNKNEEAKEVSFLSPDWKMTSQSGESIVNVLEDIDKNTEVLRVEPQNLLLVSITRRTNGGIKTVTIDPCGIDAEEVITSSASLKEEIMRKDDLENLGVDESTLSEAFIEGHFFMSLKDDCLLIPNKGFTSLICKKLRAGKMPAGLSLARDLYLSELMAMGDNPITIIARGVKASGTLKAVAAFGDGYPFARQMDTYHTLKGNLERFFGRKIEEKSWCITHQYSSIVWAVCPCGDITLGVCTQWSQTGYASLQVFPVAIYATGEIEKIGRSVSRPNTGAAVAADPDCKRLIESFGKIWKEEIMPLHDALSRAKEVQISSLKEEIARASQVVHVRKELNEKKRARFMTAFLTVPDRPATAYDVLMHILNGPVLMHRLFSGTYEMVQNVATAALAVAESEGVL